MRRENKGSFMLMLVLIVIAYIVGSTGMLQNFNWAAFVPNVQNIESAFTPNVQNIEWESFDSVDEAKAAEETGLNVCSESNPPPCIMGGDGEIGQITQEETATANCPEGYDYTGDQYFPCVDPGAKPDYSRGTNLCPAGFIYTGNQANPCEIPLPYKDESGDYTCIDGFVMKMTDNSQLPSIPSCEYIGE